MDYGLIFEFMFLTRRVSNFLLTQLDLLLPYGPTGQQRRRSGTQKCFILLFLFWSLKISPTMWCGTKELRLFISHKVAEGNDQKRKRMKFDSDVIGLSPSMRNLIEAYASLKGEQVINLIEAPTFFTLIRIYAHCSHLI